MNWRAVLIAASILGPGLFVLTAQRPAPAAVFTSAQAEAGRVAYEGTCGKCHTLSLLGRKGDPGEVPPFRSLSEADQKFIGPRGYVPPLAGETFLDRWGSKTAGQLIARFQETVDSFGFEGKDKELTVNITAYVLQVNGAKAGGQALSRTTGAIVNSITTK
jgi:hypothetical protein